MSEESRNKVSDDIVRQDAQTTTNLLNFKEPTRPPFMHELLITIIGKNDFPYHFKTIIVRYKRFGYNIDVLRQTACLVFNPIKVNNFAYLFYYTTVGRASD